jgi:hypothetical protein
MPVARLLVAVFILCASSTFAQEQHLTSDRLHGDSFDIFDNYFASAPATTLSEPWRIIPEQPQQTDSSASSPNTANDEARSKVLAKQVEQASRILASIPFDPDSQRFWIKFSPEGEVQQWGLADKVCLVLRTYVVARDSKDSDATHLVRSSICQPASRYSLKSTILKQDSQDR